MNEQNTEEIRHTIGAEGSLVLHNISGSIRLRGGDTEEVRLIARSSSGDRMPPLDVRKSDGALHVEPERRGLGFLGGSFSRSGGIDFEVELPRGARADINTVSADVEAEDLIGEQRYKTVSGDLAMQRGAGRVSVTTVSGDVRLGAQEPLELDATTTSGDIEVTAGVLRLARIRSVSGDARLEGAFQQGPEHSMESVSGDLDLRPQGGLTVETSRALEVARGGARQIVVGDGAARFRFRSMSGDVHVAGSSEAYQEAPATQSYPVVSDDSPAGGQQQTDSLAVLRALEAGEIDVEEAARRLEGVGPRA